jgi:hypothetical protein
METTMNTTTKGWTKITTAAVIALLTFGSTPVTMAQGLNPEIAPPNARPHGQSYGKWAAAWTQWVLGIPAAVNPIADETGDNAGLNQSRSVWFLAGSFGGTTERTCVVPEGTALFFPIVNMFWITTPADDPLLTIDDLRTIVRTPLDGAMLAAEIDGQPVSHLTAYRADSPVYTVTLPDDNFWGLPAGDYAPCVDNGYYLFLEPLSKGWHTIHFAATLADGSFSLDVTYHLYVGTVSKRCW